MRLLTATVKRNRFEQRNRNLVTRKLPEARAMFFITRTGTTYIIRAKTDQVK